MLLQVVTNHLDFYHVAGGRRERATTATENSGGCISITGQGAGFRSIAHHCSRQPIITEVWSRQRAAVALQFRCWSQTAAP